MRNIIEYPITKEEIIETLQRIHESYVMDIETNMTPLILSEAIKIIEDNYGNREEKNNTN